MSHRRHMRGPSSPNVDNFEQYWTDIVDDLVSDDCDHETASDSHPSPSPSSISHFTDITDSSFSSSGPPSLVSTPKNSEHKRLMKRHLKTRKQCMLLQGCEYPDETVDYSSRTPEQDVALQTYVFRIQLLSAFLFTGHGDEHMHSAYQNVGSDRHVQQAEADDGSLDPGGIASGARAHLGRRRTRLNLAEATHRARQREG